MNVLGQAPAKLIVGNTADTRQMSGEVGVISFAWAPPDGENKFRETMFGGFALPVHDGRLAIEIAKRKNGPAPEGDFTGSYDAKTYFGATPDPKKLFSNGTITINGSSAEFVGKTVFHRRLRRPRCSPSLKASLASSAAAPALTLGCAPRCRLVWAMGNGASGGGSGHRV